LKSINKKYKHIGAITFTSDGYIDLTKNLCASIVKNKIDLDLNIFCLDNKSYVTKFSEKSNNINFYENNTFQHLEKDEILRQDSEFFGDLMYKKFELIYQSLLVFDYVIYIDGDIVIKNDFLEDIFYKFPNGPKFYSNYGDINPLMIHFNYVRGDEKIELMKKYQEWYI
jgi:hypothetical protein